MQSKIKLLKTNYNHIFDIDDQGRITLKPGFHAGHGEIPPFTLVPVEGGEFTMGDGKDKDNPSHKVTVSSFFMAEFQVTQELYRAVTGENPSNFAGINHPVENVSWLDVVKFFNQLNSTIEDLRPIFKSKHQLFTPLGRPTTRITEVTGFRFPNEAEWEYAASGGIKSPLEKTVYAGCNDLDAVGWYNQNSYNETKPVGLKFPNQFGLYDMSGNVWEMCVGVGRVVFDVENKEEYSKMLLCGGSFNDSAVHSEVNSRDVLSDYAFNGVRLVLSL